MSIKIPPALGYYIAQTADATYEPGINVPCPFCLEKIGDEDVRTFNLMQAEREPYLSVFYRCHKSCYESSSAIDKENLDNIVMATLEAIAKQKVEVKGSHE